LPNKLRKILIIHHGRGLGGGLIALLGLIEELKTNNELYVLCVFDSEAVSYIKKTGIKVFLPKARFYKSFYGIFVHSEASYFEVIECIRTFKNLFAFFLNKYFFAKKELASLNFKYDILYLNSTFISDWALPAKKLNKSVIIHIREPLAKGFFGFRKNIIRDNIDKNCNQIIAISKDNALRIGIKNKTTIIYDPVVYKDRNTSSSTVLSNPKLKYFLYLGGMQRIKGFEQLVKSLPYLNEDIRIYFLGGNFVSSKNKFIKLLSLIDPFMWRINSLINRLNKSEKIIKIGLVDNIFNYYSTSLGLISPFSKPHASLPVLEAFSVGKPVIVSNVTGMDEIVSVNNGFFFKNGDEIELANAINKMAALDDVQYQTLRENAKVGYFDIMNKNGKVQSIIDEINGHGLS
jgi:glycosyltransferase involved in cell wall biosynthesis